MEAFISRKSLQLMLIALLLFGLVWSGGVANEVQASGGDILYVKQHATGDGTSWDNALGDLHTALVKAQSGDQVWIAAGTYIPTGNQEGADERTRHFQMKNGVRIYGGFPADASSETGMLDRDWEVHQTILSGDRGTDRLYHVFYHNNLDLDTTAILDGVIITGGNANALGHSSGGGMSNYKSSPLLSNVVFTDNKASGSGGGIYNFINSNTVLRNVTIIGNSSQNGGGIYIEQSSSVLINVTIMDNYSDFGGGLKFAAFPYEPDKVTIINSIISGNKASSYGGGIGLYFGNIEMINTSIYGNVSDNGGGIYVDLASLLSLTNVTLSGNQANIRGGGLNNNLFEDGKAIINNSVIWGNRAPADNNIKSSFARRSTTTITHSLIEGSGGSGLGWNQNLGTDGGKNIDANPQFVDFKPIVDSMPTSQGDYRLNFGSPAIDVGLNELYYAETNYERGLDVAGGNRIVNRNIDMGAYEYSASNGAPPPPPPPAEITPPLLTVPAGATFTAMVYDPTQKYVGTFNDVNSNGITGSLTGARVNAAGEADANGKFTKLQGVLNGTVNGDFKECKLTLTGPSMYVRMTASPISDGEFDVHKITTP